MSRLPENLEALDATDPYDVCIVGGGTVGTTLAVRFVQAGIKVLMVEARACLRERPADGRARIDCDVFGDAGWPGADAAAQLGGRDPWQDVCERLDPGDLRGHPYTPPDNPWPLAHDDLEPHYGRAEQTFRARGGCGKPPLSMRPRDARFADMLECCGIAAGQASLATPAKGAAAFRMQRELLPEFLASPSGTLVTGLTVTRLRADRNGRIIGATCRTPDGAKKTARAHTYVVACGGIETPRLLLLSKSQRFPHGIGNDHDRVGRGFNDQAILAACTVLAREGRPVLVAPRNLHARQYYRTFRRDGLGAIYPVFRLTPRFAEPLFARPAAEWPVEAWRRLAAPLASTLTIACRVEIRPVPGNRILLSRSSRDAFGNASAELIMNLCTEDRRLLAKTRTLLDRWFGLVGAAPPGGMAFGWAGDAIGTCPMGVDPETSVCDPTLRVHSCPNLYVCDAAALPTGGALPPLLTTAALAHRLADHLIARARWCSRAAPSTQRRRSAPASAPTVALVRRRPQP